ncbi:MAG: LLM class flavin-dependent oxidoreductase [Alphaproteobacteria bacterium]|nr:LLM class flavin-dependent oxidoreductase [Alphaproteobacteria bacterium]
MEFGLFDHLDRNDRPDAELYADRLAIIEAADVAGFRGYHQAEHHMTPLGLAPSPSVFLSAVAQRTSRIRLGPLVYLLPIYHPLRLIEEICMLDQLSGGRLELGVGAGISPYEVGYYGVADDRQSRFHETLAILIKGLTSARLDHHGEHHRFDDVPMVLKPIQQPMPPLWAGVGSSEGMNFAARHGMNAIGLGPSERIRDIAAFYRKAWIEHADDPMRAHSSVQTPRIGALRQIHVAASDAQAWEEAAPAYDHWYGNLNWLWKEHGTQVSSNLARDLQTGMDNGAVIVGGPDTVRKAIAGEAEATGYNYVVLQFAFGTLTRDQVLRSIDLFANEVMPAFD